MSSTAYILFEIEKSRSASELVSIIKDICNEEKIFFALDWEKFDSVNRLKYERLGISNISFLEENTSKQICLNIYDEPYENRFEEFEWDQLGNKYFSAIDFEFFVDKEDLLLKIVYPLLKIYPQAKFWCDKDWFYTSEDLEKIINRPYDKDWCYKDPKNL